MKQKLSLLFALFSMSLIFSCSKSDDKPAPAYASFEPISGKVYTGSAVTLTGNGFGTDTSKIDLRLDSKKMVITAISNTSLTFLIPQNFIPWGQKDCTLEITKDGRGSQRQVMVYYAELAHGWTYGGALPQNIGFKNLIFPTDSIGYVIADKSIYRTTDGGTTWVGDANNGSFNFANVIASSDGLNTWMDNVYQVAVSDGAKWTLGAEGRSFGTTMIGLYTAGPANGLVAIQTGRLFDVNGSFAGAAIKYQSAQYSTGNYVLWRKMSALDKNNLIIAGTAGTMILEKAGVFSEVDISSVTKLTSVKDLQLVDANTAFLVDGNNALIKYDGNTWTKLSQAANLVYFSNATTGYIVYNKKILKTTDGGATWNEEFTLNDNEYITSICGRNGKVWAIGSTTSQYGFTVKYKP